MSVLETLYILFKGDASDVKKSAAEAETAVAGLANRVVSLAGIATAAFKVFHGVVNATSEAFELQKVSRALGVDASALDAWGQAVQRNGGTAQGFQQSLKALSQHFGTSSRIALQALPKLADAFQRLGNFRAQQYGKMLGLDEATILLLQQGRREVEAVIARQKELGVVSKQDIEIANKYKIANLELELAFRSLYLSIGQTILPVLTKFYDLIVPIVVYIRGHKDLVIGAFIGIGAAAAVMLAPFIVAAAPILATGAAIAFVAGLIALLYEDIQAFRKGHHSLIGEIMERWPAAGKVIMTTIKQILNALNPLLSAMNAIKGLFSSDASIGQGMLDISGVNPFVARSSQSLYSQAFARNSSINTGDLIINTQATDANGIGRDLKKSLFSEQFWQVNNEIADGVAY